MSYGFNREYAVRDFMVDRLGLKNSALKVYAFIFDFTSNGVKTYYGTRDYIAKKLNLSVKTVSRVLLKLEKDNLIIGVSRNGSRHGKEYRVNMSLLSFNNPPNVDNSGQNVHSRGENTDKMSHRDVPKKRTSCPDKKDRMSTNYNNITTTNIIYPSSSSLKEKVSADLWKLFSMQNGGKVTENSIARFGRHELVTLTLAQYLKLTERIDEEIVAIYIAKINLYRRKNGNSNHFISDYQLIMKWIDEDYSV